MKKISHYNCYQAIRTNPDRFLTPARHPVGNGLLILGQNDGEGRALKTKSRVQWIRTALQVAVVAFFTYLVARSAMVGSDGGVTNPEAFCPFGGAEGLYQYLTSGRTLAKTHLSNLILLGAATLAVLGSHGFFCGWLCPFGAIQEWLGALGKRFFKRFTPSPLVDRRLRWLRYAMLTLVVGSTIATGTMVFQAYDPFAVLLKVGELGLGIGGLVLLAVLIASLFIDRPWCRYLCPLGAFFGIVGRVSWLRVRRNADTCISCGRCDRNCPMGLSPSSGDAGRDGACIGCLKCVSACPVANTLTAEPRRHATVGASGPQSLARIRPARQGLIFLLVGLLLFSGALAGARAAGWWSTSGRVDGQGNAVTVTADPESIKGWMTVADVCGQFGLAPKELYDQFGLPADIPASTELKDLVQYSPEFDVALVREWLKTRMP